MAHILQQHLTATHRNFTNNQDATVLIEFAVGLPFFLLMAFGGLELMNYINTHSRISHLAMSVADNASRSLGDSSLGAPSMRELDVNEVFIGADIEGGGLNIPQQGRIFLSSFEVRKNSSGNNEDYIHWQRCWGRTNIASSYGTEGSVITGGMGPTGNKVNAIAGTAIMFVEIKYTYEPQIFGSWLAESSRNINYVAAVPVRDARNLAGLDNNANAAVARCTTT